MNIKYFREKLGWSQLRLSQESGVSQTYISELEANKKQPTAPIIRKLASALGITINDILSIPEAAINEQKGVTPKCIQPLGVTVAKNF